jgi:uncharacterized protein involved in exopolysaccharide biosynthesis
MVAVREYSPLDTFQNILSHWWWVVLLALIGAGVGWVVHLVSSPVYEAKAVLAVTIDYTQTGAMTEYDQDHTIGVVKAVVLSTDVLGKVLTKAQSQQIPIDALKDGQTIFLDRKHSILELIVRNSNPQNVATLANLWAETAYETLIEAQRNAVQARVLREQLLDLQKCLQLPENSPEKPAICSQSASEDLPRRIQTLVSDVQTAEISAKGIIPPLLFEYSQRAVSPIKPVAYGANWLTFSGAMIGLLIGILWISLKGKEI